MEGITTYLLLRHAEEHPPVYYQYSTTIAFYRMLRGMGNYNPLVMHCSVVVDNERTAPLCCSTILHAPLSNNRN